MLGDISAKITALHNTEHSYHQISEILDIPRSFVGRIFHNHLMEWKTNHVVDVLEYLVKGGTLFDVILPPQTPHSFIFSSQEPGYLEISTYNSTFIKSQISILIIFQFLSSQKTGIIP